MDFTCPSCHILLEAQNQDDLRTWKCESCRGFAISLPLVRKGLDPKTFREIWGKLAAGDFDPGRSCPGCKKPLRLVDARGKSGAVSVDVCRSCHILWFDDTEFSDLPKFIPKKAPDADLSPAANRALKALKTDLVRRRPFLLKLLDNDITNERGFEKLLDDLFFH